MLKMIKERLNSQAHQDFGWIPPHTQEFGLYSITGKWVSNYNYINAEIYFGKFIISMSYIFLFLKISGIRNSRWAYDWFTNGVVGGSFYSIWRWYNRYYGLTGNFDDFKTPNLANIHNIVIWVNIWLAVLNLIFTLIGICPFGWSWLSPPHYFEHISIR